MSAYIFGLSRLVVFVVLVAGCTHGIEIEGEGDVSSASGERDCAKVNAPCSFSITDDYTETYTATPAAGYVFDSWEVCGVSNGNACNFSLPASVVKQFWGETMPFTVARFRRPIQPLFPYNNSGIPELPDTPAAVQFLWFMDQLASSSTSLSVINQRFHPGTLANIAAEDWQSFFSSLRTNVPNARVVDLITVTPNQIRAVIGDPQTPSIGSFITLSTEYNDSGRITGISAAAFPQTGTQTLASDISLSLPQISSRFAAAADNTAFLVADIRDNTCRPVEQRNAKDPLPTGSIFKIWQLGALAQAIKNGGISASDTLPFLSSEVVPAGATINDTVPGTQIPLKDMAALMMGRSDNTATDHIHELVGRAATENILSQFGHGNVSSMTPFLSANEQFQVLWGLTPEQADSYVNGSDDEQRNILTSIIEPLGPVTAFPQNNEDALRQSSWSASALDVCSAIAALRRFDNRSEEFAIIDEAFGAEVALTTVRNKWDRVWSKGGSLANTNGNYVFTLSWLFESDTRGAHVLVLLANNEDGSSIDAQPIFSLASRAAEIIDASN